MNVIHPSAIEALHRIEQQRKAREDRMRNALEILASTNHDEWPTVRAFRQHVRATAREGLGRETE